MTNCSGGTETAAKLFTVFFRGQLRLITASQAAWITDPKCVVQNGRKTCLKILPKVYFSLLEALLHSIFHSYTHSRLEQIHYKPKPEQTHSLIKECLSHSVISLIFRDVVLIWSDESIS